MGYKMDVTNMSDSGPFLFENWKAYNNNEPIELTVEYPLYTDARVIGEIKFDYGPYKLLNTVPSKDQPGLLKPSIIFRADIHLRNELPQMYRTDTSNYHGGYFSDEIAALISLCLGIRIKAADESRRFYPDGDPLGCPQAFRFRNEPAMSIGSGQLILPNAVGQHRLDDIFPIKILPKLSGEEAISVIRAARLYQDALWLSESEPALSWLMFVSALEVGANMWSNNEDDPVSKLAASKPELYETLKSYNINGLTELVANQIVPTLGVTNKFIKFAMNYLPNPPDSRPEKYAQINWSKSSMRSALGKIYAYRSAALHGGIPFPRPMSYGPMIIDGHMAEKPTGLASSSQGGVWLAEETPMLLHMFEYITRKIIINWIVSLGGGAAVR
ncbi:hypothetical protein CKOHBEJN_04364 [Aeromonas hydrophila]